jgi:hypothetical protein
MKISLVKEQSLVKVEGVYIQPIFLNTGDVVRLKQNLENTKKQKVFSRVFAFDLPMFQHKFPSSFREKLRNKIDAIYSS